MPVLNLWRMGLWGVLAAISGRHPEPMRSDVQVLMTKDLAGAGGKEAVVLTVDYAPGESEPVHRHNAQAFVYILEGSVVMQVKGQLPVTLKAGDSFYEGQDDVHLVGRNASQTNRARFVVFLVKQKGVAVAVPAQ